VREGIVTFKSGIRYRSRLEARWAAFFELLGWHAFYEPFDLDGYIPDFVLHGRKERILVEVKPVSGESDPLFQEAKAKIEKSGWKHDALIVSYFLPEANNIEIGGHDLCVGWLGEFIPWGASNEFFAWTWNSAPFNDRSGSVGFSHGRNSYHDRITGFYDGNPALLSCGHPSKQQIEKHWHDAGNAVQWQP
jgi:hypothetical protein